MAIYNLREFSDIYLRESESLWQHYINEPALNNASTITDFPADNNNSIQFKFKENITGQTGTHDTTDVEVMVPLKYLSNFWRTLEIAPINCEIKVILTWSENFCIVSGTAENQVSTFAITDTKINVPLVTLLIQDNAKLLQQLESDFNKKVNWNKHQ